MKLFKKAKSKVRGFCKKTTMKTKKHAPEILVVAGIIATGAAIVTACKKTMNVNKIVENHKQNLERMNTAVEEKKEFIDDDGNKQEYTKEVAKMDKFICYRDTTWAFVKNYAVPAGLFILGMTCFVSSTVILKKREKAAVALFNGSMAAFNAYRCRVKEAVGEEVEEKLYRGYNDTDVVYMKEDGTNEKSTIRTQPGSCNVFTFHFNDQTSTKWEDDMRYNLQLLQSIEEEINEMVFGSYGTEPVELNYVLKRLGMLKEGAMMNVGWVPEKLGSSVKNVSFGLDKFKKTDEQGGIDVTACDEILLEFNCEYIADKF